MGYKNGDTVIITPTLAGEPDSIVQDVNNWNVYKTVNSVEAFVEEIEIVPVFPVDEGPVTYTFEYEYIIVETEGDTVSFRFEPSGTESDLSDAVLGAGNGLDWEMDLGIMESLYPGGYGTNYDYGDSPIYKDEDSLSIGVPIITTAAINDSLMVSI